MSIIIIGAGEVGFHIAQRLSQEKKDVVVIEKDEEKVAKVHDTLDVQVIQGMGSSREILRSAGIDEAEMLVAVTDSDEVNMVACLVAGLQGSVPVKIARIRNPEYAQDSEILGKECLNIDVAISPELEVVGSIMKLADFPGATEVVDLCDGKVKIVGVTVDHGKFARGIKLQELRALFEDKKLVVAAIYRGNDVIIPRGKDAVHEGDLVYAVTESPKASRLISFFREGKFQVRRVILVGGTLIGVHLARQLERRGIPAKIIEEDEERCSEIAGDLEKTIVLKGVGSSPELLEEEGIEKTDLFVAVTDDEENNILTALLAKRLGAKKVIALTHKVAYAPMVSHIGVDVVVSPQLAAINRTLQHIRHGKVLSVASLREERAEALEVQALETSDLTMTPLREVAFPRGALVGAVVRGERVIIPNGESIIEPGDRVIVFALTSVIPSLEKSLTVKLEYW
jgi:trk system potassium uptake protein TrkA